MPDLEDILVAKIVGNEYKVTMILDKWRVSEYDQQRILDIIADIERETSTLTLERKSNIEYEEKMGFKRRRRTK